MVDPSTALYGLFLAVPAPVQESTGPTSGVSNPSARDERDWASCLGASRLTGDWLGLRGRMSALGADLALTVTSDTSWPFSGGVDDRVAARALFDAALDLDLARIAGWERTRGYAHGQALAGRNGSVDVGDVQGTSNLDAEDDFVQLSELWVEHTTEDGRVRVKVGKVDANSEFACVESGASLLHSSAGNSPTIAFLPTYPDPAVSLNAFVLPGGGWDLGVGVYNARDGAPVSGRRGLSADFDAAFLLARAARSWGSALGLGGGRLAVGAWHHTGELPRFDGGADDGAIGTWVLLEQSLTRPDAGGVETTGFLQWGHADGDVAEVEDHVGAGVVSAVPVHGDFWSFALYASHANLTDDPRPGLGDDELALELLAEIPLLPAVRLKPDLQLIVDPSGRSDIDDAWIATLRLIIAL